MPLSYAQGHIALVGKQFCNGDGAVQTALLSIHGRVLQAVMHWQLPGHYSGAGGSAARLRIRRGHDKPFGSEFIQGGRIVAHGYAAAVKANIHPTYIIKHKNQNIWLFTELFFQRSQFFPNSLVLLRMRDDRFQVVGNFNAGDRKILVGMRIPLGLYGAG